ncbi:hypothetical protein A0J61_11631 [Choanephora cucurbitarum]|uniref:Uncharacterized protein n=1 Tax=Choanephora cucurbitarum TaxID=101091 RepID=A0A1C7MU09_9FUNG|nr:hypothetical protein A0J61_11631 [Choanephora cucurbitarum]
MLVPSEATSEFAAIELVAFPEGVATMLTACVFSVAATAEFIKADTVGTLINGEHADKKDKIGAMVKLNVLFV